jgi:hypothetical protein
MTNHAKLPSGDASADRRTGDAAMPTGLTRREVLALLAVLGVPASVAALDPVKLAPKSYRVALENDRVRVIEYINRPGLDVCGAGRHYHPAHVTIQATAARVRVTEAGTTAVVSLKAGDIMWFDEQWHEVENVDKTTSHAYLIELKGAGWKPSTG